MKFTRYCYLYYYNINVKEELYKEKIINFAKSLVEQQIKDLGINNFIVYSCIILGKLNELKKHFESYEPDIEFIKSIKNQCYSKEIYDYLKEKNIY